MVAMAVVLRREPMGSHPQKFKPSVFTGSKAEITQARRYCVRQFTRGKLTQSQLETVVLALGIDATAEFKPEDQLRNNDMLPIWDR